MSIDVCLTPTEVEGLRELLAALAVFEERGFNTPTQRVEISALLWREMTDGPRRKLSRVLLQRITP